MTDTRYDDGYDVGDIVSESWGYDQTNVDFYRIIRRTPSMVTLRPMGAATVEGSGYSHGMADMVGPGDDVPAETSTRELFRNTRVIVDGQTMTVVDKAYHTWDDHETVILRDADNYEAVPIELDAEPERIWTLDVPTYRRKLMRWDGAIHGLQVNGHGWASTWAKGDKGTYRSWYH